MDVFDRVVNGTLYREIKYQFDCGRFSIGWRSKPPGNAVFKKGLSTIQKEMDKKWTPSQRDTFLEQYATICSFETIQKSLRSGFRTQNYWAIVEALPAAQRRAFEGKLKQRLSECRRVIAQWTTATHSESGPISNQNSNSNHLKPQSNKSKRKRSAATTDSEHKQTRARTMEDVLAKYHEIEELQSQNTMLYTNIIQILTSNQSNDDGNDPSSGRKVIGEEELNQFMTAIGSANSLYQKHKEAVSLYFEHAQIAEQQQEALQRENVQKQQQIESLQTTVDRQKQDIKGLNRSVKRKEEQISRLKKESGSKSLASPQRNGQAQRVPVAAKQVEPKRKDQGLVGVPGLNPKALEFQPMGTQPVQPQDVRGAVSPLKNSGLMTHHEVVEDEYGVDELKEDEIYGGNLLYEEQGQSSDYGSDLKEEQDDGMFTVLYPCSTTGSLCHIAS